MASTLLSESPSPENPRQKWAAARVNFEMACDDLQGSGWTDEEMEFYADAQFTAETALLLAPAPDFDALAYKLSVFRDEQAYLLTGAHDFINAMIEDAARIRKELMP